MPPRSAKSLFITYDGLLDPLGSSQILPYLRAIASTEDQLHILSFEKQDRFERGAAQLRAELANSAISWSPLIFTRSGGILGKLWDLLRMHAAAVAIAFRIRPSLVHARGHAPAQVGLLLKRLFKARLLFDFRGLWVEERVDKGSWQLTNPWHRWQYQYYKQVEQDLLRQADHLVVLTEAVVPEVLRLGVLTRDRITVIPCCADFNYFPLATTDQRQKARRQLGIPERSLVLGYLGSVGGMYLTERFLQLVSFAATQLTNVQVLVLTPDREAFLKLMDQQLPRPIRLIVHVHSADRKHVAAWLPAMNLLVAFARPGYARISMSPTKLAEAWASGIPALCNSGVGDVAQLVIELDSGMVIDAAADQELEAAVKAIPALINKGGGAFAMRHRPDSVSIWPLTAT